MRIFLFDIFYSVFMDFWHLIDFVTGWRRKILPKVHEILSIWGMFAERKESRSAYVGSVKLTLDAFEQDLDEVGFIRNFVASVKYRDINRGDRYTKGSWMFLPNGFFSGRMLHVTLYSAFDDGFVDVYAHEEPYWLTHPVKHYSTDYVDVDEGVKRVTGLLEDKVELVDRHEDDRCGS